MIFKIYYKFNEVINKFIFIVLLIDFQVTINIFGNIYRF